MIFIVLCIDKRHWDKASAESSHEAVNQMKDRLLYVKQGQEALRKATRILENKEGWNVEITEVGQTDVKFLPYFYRPRLNQSPATVLCWKRFWKRFCTFLTVIRATEMSSIAKWCRGAGGSSGWSLSWRLTSMSFTTSFSSEWRRCTSGTPASSRSRWAAHLLCQPQGESSNLHRHRVWQLRAWPLRLSQVLERVGPETVVTHEVSAQTAGNLIGQRDFVSVRHSCKHKTHVYLGGAAIQLESFPPLAGFVRCIQ